MRPVGSRKACVSVVRFTAPIIAVTAFISNTKNANSYAIKKPTVNRYLKHWGYDHETLRRPPPAVRFQADYSNECWHFDLSPSDLKQVKSPAWVQEGCGHPLLMLYSFRDGR